MANICMHSGDWENLLPLKEEDLEKLPINDTPERKRALINRYRKDLSKWGRCPKCGLVRINKQAHIDQICRVIGEKYREALFKKWTYHLDYRLGYSYVYLIEDHSPNINWDNIYDSKVEALEALKTDVQNIFKRKFKREIEKLNKQIFREKHEVLPSHIKT